MKLYFPESKDNCGVDYVGYNNAISLFRQALSDYLTDDPSKANYRVYCNLPWHHNIKEVNTYGLPLLVYTMYESTDVPSGWVSFLNKHATVVLVPSKYVKSVFENSGVRRPIFVLSLCANTTKLPQCYKHNVMEKYIYLWQGVAYDRGGRKGVDFVVDAFRELKNDGLLREDTELILKYLPQREVNFTLNNVLGADGVRFIQRKFSFEEMNHLYCEVDCCVNPTHCEGFGLIPLEQMARGKPTIITNYSIPYINALYCYPVDYILKPSPVTWNHKHLSISLCGIFYNFGGLLRRVKFLPKLMQRKMMSGDVELMRNGPMTTLNAPLTELKNKLWNRVRDFQVKYNLFYNSNKHKEYIIYQEFQGFDAFVNMQDLKRQMLYCYNNRCSSEIVGMKARDYVRKEWGIAKMKSDFKKIIPFI